MNRKIKMASAVGLIASTMALISCDSQQSLQKKLEGTWASDVENISAPGALNASVTYVMQFAPDSTAHIYRGDFTYGALVNVTNMAAPSDSIEQAYSVSAAGVVSVKGNYTVKDDDELDIQLIPSTFNVMVDPNGVILEDNLVSGEMNPVVNDSLSMMYSAKIKEQLESTFRNQFLNINEIDDIHFKHQGMKCEINDRHMMFYSQNSDIFPVK